MIRIRLSRVGKKGRPSYRIVVADVTAPRDGSYLEWIGNYDPMADPPAVTLKQDRAAHWLSMGAIPSDAVSRILDRNGLMERTPTFKNTSKKSAEEEGAGGAPAAVVTAEEAPADEAPADEVPADEAPAHEAPADEAPADEASADEAPADDSPAEETPMEESPVEEPPAEEESSGDDETAEK